MGESGSGKSTLGRLILRLHEADSGSIILDGEDVRALTRQQLRRRRRHWQIVFQEPFASLNPRLTIRQIVEEPLIVARTSGTRADRLRRVTETLEEVGLSADFLERRPANLSGGQQQRVGIARALVTDPTLVVLDEPTASLDLTIRASILRMLAALQVSRGLTYVFISHDIETVRHFCSRVAVMHRGRFVETGTTRQVLSDPQQPYTQALMLAAMPPIPYSPNPAGAVSDGDSQDRTKAGTL
ncbi:ATP-binding cassette domain-containing protein [Arthrobacter sp. I2-34]|uniref:ATP-binding cassette domain-containing protein n=1 Tax=Arthrobacter hankyongi TaxID=2904801 RepID=A0ABS9L7A3_9MICC|nr:ATP-binding cassette domain-containing protein [Arthrobacter hankyongi]